MRIFWICLAIILLAPALMAAQTPECPPGTTYLPLPFHPDRVLESPPPLDSTPPGPSGPPPSDARMIHWVHGLGGNAGSWGAVRAATDQGVVDPASPMYNLYPARKTQGRTPEYIQTDLPNAGQDLLQKIHDVPPLNAEDYSLDMVIAHSQGGIVTRYSDWLYEPGNQIPGLEDRRFFGVATFDSPHGGAYIVNSLNNGDIQHFAADACTAILSGAAANLFTDKPMLAFFVDPQGIFNTLGSFCSGFGNALLPFMLKDLTVGATQGYYVGADLLGVLDAHGSPDVYKTTIIGVEYGDDDDPANPKQLLWRTLSSFDGSSNGPVFSQNEDDDWVEQMNALRIDYQSKYEEQALKVQVLEALGYPKKCWLQALLPFSNSQNLAECLLNNKAHATAVSLRDAYARAIDWMDDADDQWKIIIGALSFDAGTEYDICRCWLDGEAFDPPAATSQACVKLSLGGDYDDCQWVTVSSGPKAVYKESDGIVTRESQEAWVGAPLAYRMDKTNHFQARNSIETAKALLKLFGEGGYGNLTWFITATK